MTTNLGSLLPSPETPYIGMFSPTPNPTNYPLWAHEDDKIEEESASKKEHGLIQLTSLPKGILTTRSDSWLPSLLKKYYSPQLGSKKISLNTKAESVPSSPSTFLIGRQIFAPEVEPLRFAVINRLVEKKMAKFELLKRMKKSFTLDALSEGVLQLVEAWLPRMDIKIDQFCRENKNKIQMIQMHGWINLRHMLGIKMETEKNEGVTFENFRQHAVDLLSEVSLEIIRYLGFQNTGSYASSGTVGFASDIDTVFMSPKGLSHEFQMVVKLIFDSLWNGLFKGLSGEQADVECYLNHPGAEFNTERKIYGDKGKAGFSRLEFDMAILQMYRAHEKNPAGWIRYKQDQLAKAYCPSFKKALEEIFAEIEEFVNQVHRDVQLQMISEFLPSEFQDFLTDSQRDEVCQRITGTNPNAYKKAKMSYKIQGLLKLSQQMDDDSLELKILVSKIERLEITERSAAENAETLHQLKLARDQIELSLSYRGAIRNTFFDETYLTQGAFNKICLLNKGQIHQRAKEKFQETIALQHKDSNPFVRKLSYQFGLKQHVKATPFEILASQQENIGQYFLHFDRRQAKEDKEYAVAVVETAKYSARTTYASMGMLRAIGKNDTRKELVGDFDALHKKTSELYFICAELEKCKRKTQLNFTASYHLLKNLVNDSFFSPKKKIAFNQLVIDVLKMDEPGGVFFNEESIIAEDKFALMLGRFLDFDPVFFESSPPSEISEKLKYILEARAGFPILEKKIINGENMSVEKAALLGLHQEAVKLTLKEFNLLSQKTIVAFNEDLLNLTTHISNASMACGLINPPAFGDDHAISLLNIWEQANKKGNSVEELKLSL